MDRAVGPKVHLLEIMLKRLLRIEKKKENQFRGVDRLNGLPDELLLHIISFLSAREAVRTCVLSKRWKNLWAYSSGLNLDCAEFWGPIKFTRFVNSYLSRRKTSQVDAFRLMWYYPEDMLLTRKWIVDALNSRPRRVSIIATISFPVYELPDSLFTCDSVETMKLQVICLHSMFQIRCKSIGLVSLKQLNLTLLTLNDESLEKLISGCPSLDELVMKKCSFGAFDFTITSHTLKNLMIKECDFAKSHAIELFVPSLLFLHVTGTTLPKISLENAKSLVQARIQFNVFDCSCLEMGYELLRGLSNATHLELIGGCVGFGVEDLLAKELPTCPAFKNLRSLHLGKWCMNTNFDSILGLVHLSPNLEMLTLHHTEALVCSPKYKAGAELAFRIECKHPKTVLIKCSEHENRVKELIDTLMANLGSLGETDDEGLIVRLEELMVGEISEI